MNEKVAALLNDQINKEFYSAYLYLDIANFYTKKDWTGLRTGMRYRRRRSRTMRCCFTSICTTTASR